MRRISLLLAAAAVAMMQPIHMPPSNPVRLKAVSEHEERERVREILKSKQKRRKFR